MASIKVRPLADNLTFGARIDGVTFDNVTDTGLRRRIHDDSDLSENTVRTQFTGFWTNQCATHGS